MKNTLLLLTLFITFTSIQAQNYFEKDNRRGQLFFKVATEYRVTPIFKSRTEFVARNFIIDVNEGAQNSGVAITLNLQHYITNNLALGFGNSLRYDSILGSSDLIDGAEGSLKDQKSLIVDFHLFFDYHFKIFKNSDFFVRLGRSMMNRGTDFGTKETIFNDEGETIVTRFGNGRNFGYFANNFAVGWKKRRFDIMLGAFTTGGTNYDRVDGDFIVPYLRFTYNVFRL